MAEIEPVAEPEVPLFPDGIVDAATAALPDTQRELFLAEKNGLEQATKLAVFVLSQELDLTDGTKEELEATIIRRTKRLQLDYHEFANGLLQRLGDLFIDQTELSLGSSIPVSEPDVNLGSVLKEPEDTASTQVENPGEISDGAQPQVDDVVAAEISNDNEIVVLESGVKLIDYESIGAPNEMEAFLRSAFPTVHELVTGLSPNAKSLLAYQVIKVIHEHERKGTEASARLADHIGLYALPSETNEIAEKFGISSGTVNKGIKTCLEQLSWIPYDETKMIEVTNNTLSLIDNSELFVEAPEQHFTIGPAPELSAFRLYEEIPGGTLDFLERALPNGYLETVVNLNPLEASVLVAMLLERATTIKGLRPETLTERKKFIEEYAGLYQAPVGISEIAANYSTNSQRVGTGIKMLGYEMRAKIPNEELDAMIEHARSTVRDNIN